MPSENLIKIMLELEDKATEAAQKADEMIKKFGNSAQQSNQKAGQSSQQLNTQMRSTNDQILESARNVRKIGRDGQDSFKQLTSSQQDAAIKFNMLDKSAQNVLNHINEYSRSGMPGFAAAVENARNKFDSLNNVTSTFSGSLDYSRSKLQMLGTDTDSLKGKIQVAGSAITTYVGTKWDGVKTKVSGLASHIQSALTGALSKVRSGIESLGSAFSGVGGIITSVFGTIGMNSFKDMTIGLAMSREQVKALGQATFGAGAGFDNMFNEMDKLTTQGVVGLDELTQAMSTIKMSTGASTEQLQQMMPVVNDIGQRAIMMGRSGDEAIALMQAAGKGLNGEFAMLQDNFGITKEKLQDLGWSGAADDVEGYNKALQEYLNKGGDMSGLLDTTQGKITTFGKNMRIAGRNIGQQFMPYLNQALDLLNKFTDPQHGNGLGQIMIGILGIGSAFMTLAPSIAPTLQAFDMIVGKGKGLLQFLGLLEAEEGALTLATLRESIASKASAAAKWIAGAATAAYSTIVGILTGEITLVSAATAVWNAILDMNPIMLVVIAIIALVAAIYEVGKAFGWWSNVQEMLDAIWSGIQRVWEAFINHPDVQAAIQKISEAWTWVSNAIMGVINSILQFFGVATGGEFDAVAVVIDILSVAFQLLTTNIRLVISVMEFLYPYFLEFYEGVLVPLGEFLVSTFAPIWDVISQVLTVVWSTVMQITDAFNQFMTGQIDLPNLLLGIWGLLQQMWLQILMIIAQAVFNFAMQVLQGAIQAGANMLNGVITYVSQLPGRVFNFLVQTTSRIIAAGVQWVVSARQKAVETVNAAVTNVAQLPGKIYNEFAKIPGKIQEAAVQAVQAASQFGQMLINAVLNAMGIHSPGIIQNSIRDEFNNTVDKIKDTIRPAGEYAAQLGEEIVDKFGNPQLDLQTDDLLPYTDLDADKFENVDIGFDSSGLAEASGMADSTNMMIGDSYAALTSSMAGSLNEMVENDNLAYTTMQANDLMAFDTISNGLSSTLTTMGINLQTQLNLMTMTHANAMNSANNTTRMQLNSMLTQTVNVTGQMRTAWSVMASEIIRAAERIKTEATTYFNQLSSTIATFYRKLQNPAQWGAGPGDGSPRRTRPVGRDPGIMGRMTTAMAKSLRRDNQAPSSINSTAAARSGYINPSFMDYMGISPSSKVNVDDLIQGGYINEADIPLLNALQGAGGWDGVVKPNVDYIKKVAREWNMRGPQIMGYIDSGLAFKVKEFENGRPNISFDSFVKMAEALFSVIGYDYYFDSAKTGSWVTALQSGSVNCSDGADALLALAATCGFSGSKVHGSWKGTGHFWTVINGKTMDTTAFQKGYGWTGPAQSGAGPVEFKIPRVSKPSRSSNSFNFNALQGLFGEERNGSDSTVEFKDDTVNELSISLDHNLNINLENVPEHIDEATLTQMISDSADDESFVKRLAQNINFQKYDLKEKLKIERKNKRDAGVGI